MPCAGATLGCRNWRVKQGSISAWMDGGMEGSMRCGCNLTLLAEDNTCVYPRARGEEGAADRDSEHCRRPDTSHLHRAVCLYAVKWIPAFAGMTAKGPDTYTRALCFCALKWMCRLRGIEARFASPAFAGMTAKILPLSGHLALIQSRLPLCSKMDSRFRGNEGRKKGGDDGKDTAAVRPPSTYTEPFAPMQ